MALAWLLISSGFALAYAFIGEIVWECLAEADRVEP